MASVTQCDACGNVVKHQESKYLRINNVTRSDAIGSTAIEKEICKECYDKILKLINESEEE